MNIQSNNREVRSRMAKETLEILESGFYMNSFGKRNRIEQEVRESIAGSILYSPEMLPKLKKDAKTLIKYDQGIVPNIKVTDETTLGAARRLVTEEGFEDTICLNFASAKNPGGGFLGGSQAQEESLARSSALYPCIAQKNEMYNYNRGRKTCLYSDYMIYSPQVPVFREDRGNLLDSPYRVSMITAPAVNAGVVKEREPENVANIRKVMLDRIRYILAVSAMHGHKAIILGAFGCGVFRNDPKDIATIFKQVLIEESYSALFEKIVFAIFDKSENKHTKNAFSSIIC
ncbi:TIGR02452 family protein [Paenibacillus sp. SYP-B3998]|uniref:TIGR02452 family protein n=1 Tax=Paenibacillus sp. SYP-B3998 TaxID=2678564 RepID=A0A6G3ZXV0_9BACL|nr:TIGR02452 family protein [Paenibacillus sp. SYP-B3998]NEW06401.1 TIGR02452 family protein [Paenibacillus sp. SYP-B3998]